MPTRLPNEPKVKTIRADDGRRVETRVRATATKEAADWLLIWSLSIGFCAAVLAAIAFFAGNDPRGAAVILFGAAAVMGLVLRASAASGDRD